jgi:glutamate synthase (NADPH/NADH) small chain
VTKPTGFLEIGRRDPDERDVAQRVKDFRTIERRLPVIAASEQARRCMGCGVAFCHSGCPLGNVIPDFNDAAERGRWQEAFAALDRTNNFPEITGRICPAPCESACVLGVNDEPVTIEAIEREIADQAFEHGWVKPRAIDRATGKRVAIVGSGPAGLAAAQQLRRAGHRVTVYERAEAPGGLLRFGIPDFKLEKVWLDRRLEQITSEGVEVRCGVDVDAARMASLRAEHDAVLIATGATVARDLDLEGRALAGIHVAMDFLTAQNRVVRGSLDATPISAAGRDVVILGGGDTGSDCLGTAIRQGARSVRQIELLPRPPETRAAETPWPLWPTLFRVSSSQEEGGERSFALRTVRFLGEGRVRAIECVEVARVDGKLVDVPGTEQLIETDLVLLALGFSGPERAPLAPMNVLDARGLVSADATRFETPAKNVFACGDARRGQSLVVWAIWEGRQAAHAIDEVLMRGETTLPSMRVSELSALGAR